MANYILRRLLLIIPTLWAIITINFFIVQIAPGGPVDQMIATMSGVDSNMVMERISGQGAGEVGTVGESSNGPSGAEAQSSRYRGARGLDPEVIAEIERRFGFDKPLHVRYLRMLASYGTFNFGRVSSGGAP